MEVTTTALLQKSLEAGINASQAALDSARSLILDVLGVTIAGSATSEASVLINAVKELDRSGNINIPVFADTFDISAAGLVTGTMAYSIGLTDTHSQSITHPGPSVVAAALVVGAHVGADDETILCSIISGVEAIVRIGAVVNPSHRKRGFHATATCNPFGVAITVSQLLGLTFEQTLNALGIVGSMVGGLYEFRNEGSMLMALHGGWPVETGITAAFLAKSGFTGPSTVLEGNEGFFHGFADTVRSELLLVDNFQNKAGVEELSYRPYNACRYAHSGIDALLEIQEKVGHIDAANISKVIVWTHKTAVDQEAEPSTLVSARLSTAFNIALAIVHGPRLEETTEEDLEDTEILSLLEKISIAEDETLTSIFPKKWACRLEIHLKNGDVYENQVEIPKGDPANPLTKREQLDKFNRLTIKVLGAKKSDAIAKSVLYGQGGMDLASLIKNTTVNKTK